MPRYKSIKIAVNSILFLGFFLCLASHITAQETLHSKEGPEINGIRQYLEIDSKDSSKPLLLFLHGGPGFGSTNYLKSVKNKLLNDFIVIQWDQRETGTTKAWNSSESELTTELFHQDTEAVIDYLLARFDREKLYLVGFSWGGFMGLTFADRHPEKLHAYVSVSAVFSSAESEKHTLETIKTKAKETGNTEAEKELEQIQLPFENWEQLYFQRKWTAFYSGVKVNARTYPRSLFGNWSKTWFSLYTNASKVNFFETTPELACPVYFFVAKKDLVANHTEAERYYNHVKAPTKEIVWFEESTHEIPNQEPKKLAMELLRISEKTTP